PCWSLAPPGAREEEVSDLLQRGAAGIGALPGHVTRLADADVLRALLGQGSSQSHHLLAVPDLVRGLLEEVAEHILAAEITAAPDDAAREVDGEVHPRLMAESIERALGSLGGVAQDSPAP